MSQPTPQSLLKGLQYFQKAKALHAAGALAPAAEAYRLALQLMPSHPQLLIHYGQLATDVKDWAGAEKIYRRLMAVSDLANVDGKLAEALFNQDRNEDAIPYFTTFVARNPGDAVALRLLSTACFRSKRFEDAIRYARQSWALLQHPDTICLLLATYVELGDGNALAPLVEQALALYPDHWQVRKLSGEHLLKAGDYTRGFRFFTEMRIPVEGLPHYVQGIDLPWWDGKPFDGTLLVGAEQGIGDEILTASMYADLVAMGQRAIIEADARLLTLLRRAWPALTFIPRNEGTLRQLAESEPGARKIISGNLGEFFRPSGWPGHAGPGWFTPDPVREQAFRRDYDARWPGQARVGISWKSQRQIKSGVRKGVDLAGFLPLLQLPGAAFVSLQYGEIAEDLATLPDPSAVFVDPGVDTRDDMEALFAQVAALDLVITTSNVTAHVAGAMGKPCWVLLPRARPVIWYWGYRGERTPWYPQARLFRNAEEDNWDALFARVTDSLRDALLADELTGARPASGEGMAAS